MAAPALPLILAGAALLFALASKKKASSSSGGGGGGGGGMTGPPVIGCPVGPDGQPTCFDAGMSPALVADVANALAQAAQLGPAALLEKAAAIGKMNFPCAAACLKQAAEHVAAGAPGVTPTGIVLPGGGHPGFIQLGDGTKIPIPDLGSVFGGGAGGGMTMPSPAPMPTGPTATGLPSWCNPALGICFAFSDKKPPFNTANLSDGEVGGGHGHFMIRSGDLPNALAAYYTGDASRAMEMHPYNDSGAGGVIVTSNGKPGPGWKIGQSVVIPASWNPYAKPKPVAGSTNTPLTPIQYPDLPSVPPVPGIDITPEKFAELLQKLANPS